MIAAVGHSMLLVQPAMVSTDSGGRWRRSVVHARFRFPRYEAAQSLKWFGGKVPANQSQYVWNRLARRRRAFAVQHMTLGPQSLCLPDRLRLIGVNCPPVTEEGKTPHACCPRHRWRSAHKIMTHANFKMMPTSRCARQWSPVISSDGHEHL